MAGKHQTLYDFCMENEDKRYLLDEWDSGKNILNPNEIGKASAYKIWWKCNKGHSFEQAVFARTSNNYGCPYCSGRYPIKGETDLATTHPHLIKEWDFLKNDIKPDEISAGSAKNAWWLCEKGHSYVCRIGHRTSDNVGCPYCSGLKTLKGFNDLCTTHPNLVKEWNYKRNILKPEEVSKGCNKKVWWVCQNEHEWEDTVGHRTSGRGCPVCSGHKIVKGINDLKTWCFENNKKYLLDEWDYSKNEKNPEDYTKGSRDSVWWVCSKGHEWEARISNRTLLDRGCPICTNKQVLKGVNDFATLCPKFLEEWDFDKNKIKPDEIAGAYSQQKVWWKCKSGHSWKTTIAHRTLENTGCPYCFSERQTSFSEQAIFYYINQIFSDALNSYNIGKQFELDIFIPSLSIGIEYDGSAWHQNIDKDNRKNKLCESKGIILVRIREENCPKMDSSEYLRIIECKAIDIKKYIYDLNGSIKDLFCILEKSVGKKIVIDIDVERDRNLIYAMYKQNKYEKSLEYLCPDLMKEWDYDLNKGIDPSMFTLGSETKVHWVCEKGHKYESRINNRTKVKIGCPYCNNRKVLKGFNDLATTHPNLLEEWDFNKNIDISPYEIHSGSELSVWWKCSTCGYEWESRVYSRKSGCGCPNCGRVKAAKSRGKKVINLDTGEIFDTLKDAAKSTKLKTYTTISDCCKGKIKTAGGYHWAYYEE